MKWLERIRRGQATAPTPEPPGEPGPGALERASPALAALFRTLHDDGRHSVLDLGPAGSRHLRLLGRYARQIRFAGLIPRAHGDASWTTSIRELPFNTDEPYDVVLAWDLLDRLRPEERPGVIARFAEITAPEARVYMMVNASGATMSRPIHFTLLEPDRVSQREVGPPEPANPELVPAKLERILPPFQVTHAFYLRSGWREYVVAKRD